MIKQTFEGTLGNKNAFFASKTDSVFDSFLHIDHLELFQVIAHLKEQRLLYKTLYIIINAISKRIVCNFSSYST
jgi:hypothetical protein